MTVRSYALLLVVGVLSAANYYTWSSSGDESGGDSLIETNSGLVHHPSIMYQIENIEPLPEMVSDVFSSNDHKGKSDELGEKPLPLSEMRESVSQVESSLVNDNVEKNRSSLDSFILVGTTYKDQKWHAFIVRGDDYLILQKRGVIDNQYTVESIYEDRIIVKDRKGTQSMTYTVRLSGDNR